MRIGTWNLEGRWTDDHERLLVAQDCDVWLLTEVNERLRLDGYSLHATAARMAARRHWAAVAAREPIRTLTDPHPASAAVVVAGTTYCSSILPWRACGGSSPWRGDRHQERTANALGDLHPFLESQQRLVWGGDWNHALVGREYSGSKGGRLVLQGTLDDRGLDVPTAELPHRIEGLAAIDHVAVPRGTVVKECTRVDARGLSDHDLYVVHVAD